MNEVSVLILGASIVVATGVLVVLFGAILGMSGYGWWRRKMGMAMSSFDLWCEQSASPLPTINSLVTLPNDIDLSRSQQFKYTNPVDITANDE